MRAIAITVISVLAATKVAKEVKIFFTEATGSLEGYAFVKGIKRHKGKMSLVSSEELAGTL